MSDLPPLPPGEGRGEGQTIADSLHSLLLPQALLRSRFDDFRRAFDRRDRAAYEMALRDFEAALRSWTQAEERVLLPVLARTGVPGRDPQRELKLEYVQVRELTRYLLEQVGKGGSVGDILGLIENLDGGSAAHEGEMERIYYPAAAPALTEDDRLVLDARRSSRWPEPYPSWPGSGSGSLPAGSRRLYAASRRCCGQPRQTPSPRKSEPPPGVSTRKITPSPCAATKPRRHAENVRSLSRVRMATRSSVAPAASLSPSSGSGSVSGWLMGKKPKSIIAFVAVLTPGSAFPRLELSDTRGNKTARPAGEALYGVFKTTCPTCELAWPFSTGSADWPKGGALEVVAVSQDDAGLTAEFNRRLGVQLRDPLRRRTVARLGSSRDRDRADLSSGGQGRQAPRCRRRIPETEDAGLRRRGRFAGREERPLSSSSPARTSRRSRPADTPATRTGSPTTTER